MEIFPLLSKMFGVSSETIELETPATAAKIQMFLQKIDIFSRISRERLDYFSIRKLRWRCLVGGYNPIPIQIFDKS